MKRPFSQRLKAAWRILRGKSLRSYDAASTGRRLSGMTGAGSSSANVEVQGGLVQTRQRARELVRNDAYAASFVEKLSTYLVGTGIRPRCDDDRAMALWEQWVKQAPVEYEFNLYGQQLLAARAWAESGEVLIRRRPRFSGDMSAGAPLAVPLQMQTIESDQLDHYKTGLMDGTGPMAGIRGAGGQAIMGVQFDRLDRRVAYWLYPYHPGDVIMTGQESVSVPAEDIIHLYRPLRPGQVRGITWMAPVIQALHDLGGYRDAELVKQRLASCLAAFVTTDDPDEEGLNIVAGDGSGQNVNRGLYTDSSGNPLETIEPGMVAILRGGKTVNFSNPPSVQAYADYVVSNLHGIAAGFSMPYELLSGDLSRVNYSSIRFGMLSFVRMLQSLQETILIPTLCDPVWRWFVFSAIEAGKLPRKSYPVVWAPQAFEDVDRVKEATADLLEVRAGTSSLKEILARKGKSTLVLEEIAQTNAILDKLQIVLDSDPRKTTTTGNTPRSGPDDPDASRSIRALLLAARKAQEDGDGDSARDYALVAGLLSNS